jgi:hypothetical protein
LAVVTYCDVNGHYPPPYVTGPDGRPWHSWRLLILPYIEESKLHQQYNFNEPWDGPNNSKLAERIPRMFQFHGTRTKKTVNTTTNYLAVVGAETIWNPSKPVTVTDVTDELDNTILIVENNGAEVHWMEPRDLLFSELDLRLGSPVGISTPYDMPAVVTVSKSVTRLQSTLKPETLRALLTIAGKEPLVRDGGWDLIDDGRLRSRKEE